MLHFRSETLNCCIPFSQEDWKDWKYLLNVNCFTNIHHSSKSRRYIIVSLIFDFLQIVYWHNNVATSPVQLAIFNILM